MNSLLTFLPQLEAVEKSLPQSIENLFEYLRFETVSKDSTSGRSFNDAVIWLSSQCQNAGLNVQVYAEYGRPIVVASSLPDPKLPTVLFYGHYDVQPAGDVGGWTTAPFEPEIRNDRIYARGVGDNKGQNFCHIEACRIVLQHQDELPCNIKILFEGEEETGSPSLMKFLSDHKDRMDCDLVITCDGPMHESGKPTVVLAVVASKP